jgi:tetratricopeptide (TPR) repeat protein
MTGEYKPNCLTKICEKLLRSANYLCAFSVALLTFLVFIPSLQNAFVNWDDATYVYSNYHIRSLGKRFFNWAFFDFYAGNWHPLTWISHAVDYAVWGLNPIGHHLSNLLIHSVNSFLVVLLVIRLLQSPQKKVISDYKSTKEAAPFPGVLLPALVTGLLFGIHPVHVESVAWISERKDVLCACFFLLSLFVYAGYAGTVSRHPYKSSSFFGSLNNKYLVSLGSFFLALLSKPMAVSLPAVLLILDWYPFGRLRKGNVNAVLIEKTPFILLSAVSSFITILAQQDSRAVVPLKVIPLGDRIIVMFYAVFSYIRKFVIPVNLLPFYQYPKNIDLFSSEFFLPVAFVFGITLLCAFALKRRRIFAAVWCYFFITLLPVLGIVQVGEQAMADRYTYIPSIGPFLLVGIGSTLVIQHLMRRIKKHAVAIVASAICILLPLAALSELSFRQIKIWRDGETLWNRVVKVEPSSVVGLDKLGEALYQKGKMSEAITLYERALAIEPWNTEALNNLAICFIDTKQYDKALFFAISAATAKPTDGKAFNTLGEIYFARNEYQNALHCFRRALSIDATIPLRNFNIALTLEKMGKIDEACRYWMRYFDLVYEQSDKNEVSLHLAELNCGEREKSRPALSR